MYGTTTLATTGATGALAISGVNGFWAVVTGVSIVMAAVMVTRLRPKREY